MSGIKKQTGGATLILTVVLLVSATLMMFYAAQHHMLQQKIIANQNMNSQAYYAADAGIEFGIVYLGQHTSTVATNPTNGFINYGATDSNLTNVQLNNGSKFSIVYTNPTQYNYQLIQITSTGQSADGTATRVLHQQVYSNSPALKYAIVSQSNMVASGNVTVTGQNGVDLGGTFTKSGNIKISQFTQHDATLANMSASALFSSIFGMSTAQMQAQSTYYANSNSINFNALSGKVWINSNVSISGNSTIGSATNPVLIIINGNFTGSGTVTIYGLLYIMGTTTISGNLTLNGGLISQGAITMSGTSAAYSVPMVGVFTSNTYAKVSGSWKDF